MQRHRRTGQGGFTLIEVVVAMGLFLVIIMLAGRAFNSALSTSQVVSKSEGSNIEGVVGLEMMRHDLELAGFGLYTDVDSPIPTFSEAAAGTTAASYNDSSAGVPRAIVGGNNLDAGNTATVLTGTDYLAIKSTNVGLTAGTNQAAQKWTYINYTSASLVGRSKAWPKSDDNLVDGVDKVVVMRQVYKSGVMSRKLVYETASPTTWAQTFKADGSYTSTYKPNVSGLQFYYYGLGIGTPQTPFNRVDYVVKRVPGEMNSSCAPGAGTLYRSVMSQVDGSMTSTPVLDCVADMQVVLGWNTGGAGGTSVDNRTSVDGITYTGTAAVAMSDPTFIRTSLKVIKVYILAQDGGFDKSYTNTATPVVVGDPDEQTLTSSIDLSGANYQNYRWKLYRIVVRPLNLN